MNELTQNEADTLRTIEKLLISPSAIRLPSQGESSAYKLNYTVAKKTMTNMEISVYRGRINSRKASYKLIYNGNIILIRLDLNNGSMHRNPDGSIIGPNQPHIHIYDENHGDKFARPVPECFNSTDNIIETFRDFLSYSNVINVDAVTIIEQEVLFR